MATRKPPAEQVLKAALEIAASMNNANARVEAKVDALIEYIASQATKR